MSISIAGITLESVPIFLGFFFTMLLAIPEEAIQRSPWISSGDGEELFGNVEWGRKASSRVN